MRRAAVFAAAALALPAPAAAQARTPSCPASVGAPSAIVIEVSTGQAACVRAPDRRRPVGSTTKLMTALLTLERAKLSQVFTASSYRPAPVESKIGLLPGERMKVRDLMRGLLIESGNDAAAALAQGVAGSQRAFVKLMNARALQLGLKNTHYENAIGLDSAGNYSSARDLVTLATVLRTDKFFKHTVNLPSVTLRSGAYPRTFANRNLLVRRYGFVNGVKTGHTLGAGYVLVGSASRHGIQLISAVLDEPSEAARDDDTMRLFDVAFKRFERIRAVVKGRTMATVPIRERAGAQPRPGGGPDGAADRPPRAPARRQDRRPRAGLGGGADLPRPEAGHDRRQPGRPARRHGAARGRRARPPGRPRPADQEPRGGAARADRRRDRRRGRYVAGGTPPAPQVPPAAPAGGAHRMIVTVTLNTAIDKTLSVPNFRLGRRHRTVEQTTMPGGKGVNVARVLKALGAPVIATGLAGGPTGTRDRRAADPAQRAVGLRAHRRGVAHEHGGDRPDDGRADRDQRARPARDPRELELFADKLLYLAKGASLCVFAGSLPRDVDVDIYAQLIRELKRREFDHDHRHRRRPAAPRRARGAGRDLAERARGRGACGPRVQRRRRPHLRRPRDVRAGRARGDHDDAGRLLRPDAGR